MNQDHSDQDKRHRQTDAGHIGADQHENSMANPPTSHRTYLGRRFRLREGLSFRAFIPNAMTAAALCCGLTGVKFAFSGDWDKAAGVILIAGILDGLDGRVARLLKAQSRFGAELDSLSDAIAFGVAPALLVYLWTLQYLPRFGWTIALALAVCCALRLARFNAQIDQEEQPHKSAGFLTGVPAPAGAGMACLPIYLWLETGLEIFRNYFLVAPWLLLVTILLISNIATYSWGSLRVTQHWRLPAIAAIGLLVASLLNAPWLTLSLVVTGYLLTIPFSILNYYRVKKRRKLADSG